MLRTNTNTSVPRLIVQTHVSTMLAPAHANIRAGKGYADHLRRQLGNMPRPSARTVRDLRRPTHTILSRVKDAVFPFLKSPGLEGSRKGPELPSSPCSSTCTYSADRPLSRANASCHCVG